MNKKIITHFKKTDPILYSIIENVESPQELSTSQNHFLSLITSIISQQLSERVSDVIFARFEKLFPNSTITSKDILRLDDEVIRKVGISYSKIKYMKGLARAIEIEELDLSMINQLENDEVISQLTKIKGIGQWTAEMFLMFSLGREDIFSHGDLGLKNAIKKLYNLSSPTKEDIEKITKKWIPYRTYACMLLWRSLSITTKKTWVKHPFY